MPLQFQPVIKRARFNPVGFSSQTMLHFGNVLLRSIQARLDKGQTIYDTMSPPLKDAYLRRKERTSGSNLRDLRLTGRTRRSMKVIEAGQDYCILGFTDAEAANRVRWNNLRSRQWGVSPRDERALAEAVFEELTSPVQAQEWKVA
jgi:hypothetical protein